MCQRQSGKLTTSGDRSWSSWSGSGAFGGRTKWYLQQYWGVFMLGKARADSHHFRIQAEPGVDPGSTTYCKALSKWLPCLCLSFLICRKEAIASTGLNTIMHKKHLGQNWAVSSWKWPLLALLPRIQGSRNGGRQEWEQWFLGLNLLSQTLSSPSKQHTFICFRPINWWRLFLCFPRLPSRGSLAKDEHSHCMGCPLPRTSA